MIINTHKVLSFTQAKIDGLYFGCLGLTDIYCGCRKPPRHQKNVLDFNQWQKQIKQSDGDQILGLVSILVCLIDFLWFYFSHLSW